MFLFYFSYIYQYFQLIKTIFSKANKKHYPPKSKSKVIIYK